MKEDRSIFPVGLQGEKGSDYFWLDAVRDFWEETGLSIDSHDLLVIVNWFDKRRASDSCPYPIGTILFKDNGYEKGVIELVTVTSKFVPQLKHCPKPGEIVLRRFDRFEKPSLRIVRASEIVKSGWTR